ncbi:MAG: hypothetical protein ABFD89_16935 [Bryobacteraceae bacterium]
MTEKEALDILRAQGHAVGTPDSTRGTVRIWVHASDHFVDVRLGHELVHLAEGKITIEDLEEGSAAASA